jgi:hypothetical protein
MMRGSSGRFRETPGFMTHLHYPSNRTKLFCVFEGVLSVYLEEVE